MSTTEAPETPSSPDAVRVETAVGAGVVGGHVPRPKPLGQLVSGRVQRLQGTRGTSATTATLARLRANVGARPGVDPAIWSVTIDGISPGARTDEPTREENAAHLALTLYAVHQQSRDSGAHRPGIGLGQAVARLERDRGWTTQDQDEGKVSPVRRRFNAVVTASSLTELAHHLRGLVTLMRAEDVGLDYAMLADDLLQFQQAGGRDIVRRSWGRQLHHRIDATVDTGAAIATNNTSTTENAPTEEDQ